ncbi:uncharacterized protein LOC106875771 isoform X2 [Octopus bimaculoides]|uniref:uncharacterized protein LOC106875771 isoform X2 n=1 Tax=Octopus bimaculoides TaxID=37653 RepID=UPI00071C281D|nr:uncharacterized protein LOC106875771 isoform X2 [Octopus bimaculoides]|eukprot:XP_014779519.1 PREDICTED: uncharacterized protein LOC106875771 isoform X2 [Octopus bimaculoides]
MRSDSDCLLICERSSESFQQKPPMSPVAHLSSMASVLGSTIMRKNGPIIYRSFSRTALPLLKISQAEGSTSSSKIDQFILPVAVFLSLFGFSVSLFSTRQLYDNSSRSPFKR